MSKVGSILLLGDSASALPGFDSEKTTFIDVKPGEIIWNNMQCEEPSDGASRQLFDKNAEILASSSRLIDSPRWLWADYLADKSIEHDAMFVFAPHEAIFPQQHAEIMKALVLQKTHYTEFFRRHQRKTGKLKTFEVKTENWFGGVGLVMWQCQQLLAKLDREKQVSLTQLKSVFGQLAKRTRTIPIMPTHQLNAWTRSQVLEESFLGRLSGSLSKSKWVTFQLGYQQSDTGDKETLSVLTEAALRSIVASIEQKQLGFARIVISCNQEQLEALKGNAAFLQFDRMQSSHGFKWVHQPSAITSQILTGKDAIHFSYAVK